jgi:hypothetical protein
MLLVLRFPHGAKVGQQVHDLYQWHPIEIMTPPMDEEWQVVDCLFSLFD